MKRVLFISNIPSPYRSRFFRDLGKYTDLTVIYESQTTSKIKFSFKYDDFDNHKIIYLSKDKVNRFIPNFAIIKHLLNRKYDFIFLTNYGYPTELLVYLIFNLLKVKFYFEFDGALLREENRFKYHFKKFVLSGATKYLSPSKKASEYLEHYKVPINKIVNYPFTSIYFSDIRKLSQRDKKAMKMLLNISKEIVILFVGRIIYMKGIDVLINALKEIDAINYRLIVIGDSPDTEYMLYIQDLIKSSISGSFSILAFMDSEELDNYYLISDIFVFPTRYDPWGLVLNEAMAKGIAVIASDKSSAANELVFDGFNGFIYESSDYLKLAKYLTLLIESEALRLKLGFNAQKTIENYTIEKMVEVHLNFIEKENNR